MTEQTPIELPPQRLRLRVEDYLLLDDSGAFEGRGKTELIDGEVFLMAPQHLPHALIKTRLAVLLGGKLASSDKGLEAVVEPSVAVPPHDMPQPDIVVLSAIDSRATVPLESVRLAVEVSDSSLDIDLGRKLATYARAGIPEYWVVDVRGSVIHQFWSSASESYVQHAIIAFGDPIAAATIDGLAVETATL